MATEQWTPRRILELRKSMDLSQRAMAPVVGVCYQTICNWERGRNSPHPIYRGILDSIAAKR